MDEHIEQKIDHAGKVKRHELTGLEIKLLVPTRNGWRAQVIGHGGQDYMVNIDNDSLLKRYRDVVQ